METANWHISTKPRPPGLTLTALLSNLTGLVTVLATLLWARWQTHVTSGETVLVMLAAVSGCGAAIAGIGLLRLWPGARMLQILVSLLWMAGASIAIVWGDRRTAGPVIITMVAGAIPAVAALFYLTRDRIAELFGGDVQQRGGAFLVAVDIVLIATAVFFVDPAFRRASARSPVKRAMAELRLIATAVESYATDHDAYPSAQSLESLVPHISPTYLREVPRLDPWKSPYRYEAWTNDDGPPQHYALASAGSDRRFTHDTLRLTEPGPSSDPARDLVLSDGDFIAWLESSPPSPLEPADALEEATAAYQDNRFGDAVPLYRQVLDADPDDELSHARLAFSLIQLERWDEAAVSHRREIELNPASYMAHNNLALIYEKLDALEPALVSAREAVRLRPEDANTRNTLGFVLLRSGEYPEAIEHLQIALRLDPDLVPARLNLGRAYALAGDIVRARAELAKLEAVAPVAADELRAVIASSDARAARQE